MIKKFNESFDKKLYLLQEDGGDCLYSKGVYDDLDKFIEDIKSSLSETIKNVERSDECIKIRTNQSYYEYFIYEININELI